MQITLFQLLKALPLQDPVTHRSSTNDEAYGTMPSNVQPLPPSTLEQYHRMPVVQETSKSTTGSVTLPDPENSGGTLYAGSQDARSAAMGEIIPDNMLHRAGNTDTSTMVNAYQRTGMGNTYENAGIVWGKFGSGAGDTDATLVPNTPRERSRLGDYTGSAGNMNNIRERLGDIIVPFGNSSDTILADQNTGSLNGTLVNCSNMVNIVPQSAGEHVQRSQVPVQSPSDARVIRMSAEQNTEPNIQHPRVSNIVQSGFKSNSPPSTVQNHQSDQGTGRRAAQPSSRSAPLPHRPPVVPVYENVPFHRSDSLNQSSPQQDVNRFAEVQQNQFGNSQAQVGFRNVSSPSHQNRDVSPSPVQYTDSLAYQQQMQEFSIYHTSSQNQVHSPSSRSPMDFDITPSPRNPPQASLSPHASNSRESPRASFSSPIQSPPSSYGSSIGYTRPHAPTSPSHQARIRPSNQQPPTLNGVSHQAQSRPSNQESAQQFHVPEHLKINQNVLDILKFSSKVRTEAEELQSDLS